MLNTRNSGMFYSKTTTTKTKTTGWFCWIYLNMASFNHLLKAEILTVHLLSTTQNFPGAYLHMIHGEKDRCLYSNTACK